MRAINKIIIHCSATPPNRNIGAAEIRTWHMHGNKWSDIGYHFVIRRDGTLEEGRPLDHAGAHCKGHNANSIGICLVGGLDSTRAPENNFTSDQWASLGQLVKHLTSRYPTATIHGHNEFAAKACPSFDVKAWVKTL